MVDFAALGRMDPAELAAREAASREEFLQREEAERDRLTKKALTITLQHEPETRMTPAGERMMLLRGVQDGQSAPLTAVYKVPTRTAQDEEREAGFDRTLRALGGGDRVTLGGQWSKRGWNDAAGVRRETWEFKTQLFEKGDVPLERMLENARAERRGEEPTAPGRDGLAPRGPGRAAVLDAGNGR